MCSVRCYCALLRPCCLLYVMHLRWTVFFFFSSRRRHTRCLSDWSSDVCSSDLVLSGNCDPASVVVVSAGSLVVVAASVVEVVVSCVSAFSSSSPHPARSRAPRKTRSEERRVGKEGRSGWAQGQ